MDPEVTPKPEKTKSPLKKLMTPLKNLLTLLKNLVTPLKNLVTPLKNLVTPLKNLVTPLKKLPIPKKLVIPVIAGAVLLIAGGAAFGLLHARLKQSAAPQGKTVASAPIASKDEPSKAVASTDASSKAAPSTAESSKAVPSTDVSSKAEPSTAVPSTAASSEAVASTTVSSKAVPSAACAGVVRDIYRQTVDEDPSVTLADVRSEVLASGVNCAPVPEIAAELKDLSPACRDMVQYTFLGVRNGDADVTVSDIREKVVEKSVACEHDRRPTLAAVARHKGK